jgi:hypothetical protein
MCNRCGQGLSPAAARRVASGCELPTLHQQPGGAPGPGAQPRLKRKARHQGSGSGRRAAAAGQPGGEPAPVDDWTQTDAWLTALGTAPSPMQLSPAAASVAEAASGSRRAPAEAVAEAAAAAVAAPGGPAGSPAGVEQAALAGMAPPAQAAAELEPAADADAAPPEGGQPRQAGAGGGGGAAAAAAAGLAGTPALMPAPAAPPQVQAAAGRLADRDLRAVAYQGTPAEAGG